ncbi:proteophosphoglycan protein [Ceratobasidium sp. AG-Ba]|nr:proteophosphoglycan protein [Ceratobasidium sp. AG-Ba]
MSSSLQLPSGLSITGGIPIKSQDLAPSIIFIVAYAILIPLAVFRIVRKESRSTTLIRPAIFIVVRIATYILRALQANGKASISSRRVPDHLRGYTIAARIPHHPDTHQLQARSDNPTVTRLLRIALLVALIIGIVAGTQYSSALSDPSKLDTLRTLRNVNAGLCLAIVIGVIVVVLVAQVHKICLFNPQYYLSSWLAVLWLLAKFYILLTLMEWLVTATLFAFNVRMLFAEDLAKEKKDAAKRGEQQGQAPYEQVPMGTRSPNQHYKDPYASA